MDIFRKIIAGICSVLFVISSVIALLAFNIERKAFNSATYKQAFENQKLYERTPEILASALHTSIAEDVNADPFLKPLTVEDWEATISALLPPDEIKTLTDDTLDSIFNYLNGNSDAVVISLLPFKRHLAGPAGVEVVKQILLAQPACTADQLMQIGFGLLSGDITFCNPPEEFVGLMTPLIESQLQVMTVAIPDEVKLPPGSFNNTSDDPRINLNRIRALMKITPFFPLFFLFGVSVFALRGLTDWLKWWGWPFFIAGSVSSSSALLGTPVIDLIIQRAIQSQGAGFMPPILLSTLRETASTVTTEILKPVVIEALILAVSGLLMVLVAAYLVKKEVAVR